MKRNKKARYMTLLEVLIAITLISSLLVTLFSIFRYVDNIHHKINEAEKTSFQSLYVQSRLSRVFSLAQPKPEKKEEAKHFYFYTSTDRPPYLVFVYDNQAAVPPIFSNNVLGKIFVDENDRLCLTTWPSPDNFIGSTPPVRKEILMEGVEFLNFEFYLPPRSNIDEVKVDPSSDEFHGKWLSYWPVKIYDDKLLDNLPAMIKIKVSLKEKKGVDTKPITFAFLLPHTKDHLIYHR